MLLPDHEKRRSNSKVKFVVWKVNRFGGSAQLIDSMLPDYCPRPTEPSLSSEDVSVCSQLDLYSHSAEALIQRRNITHASVHQNSAVSNKPVYRSR